MALQFYGLMVAPLDTDTSVNLVGGTSAFDAYLRCAAVCHASFAYHGYAWTLVTDAPDLMRAGFEQAGLEAPPIRAVDLAWKVPADLRFRAAHYKLELLQQFSTGDFGERVGLVDLDAVCIADLPPAVTEGGALCGYDISDVVQRSPDEQNYRTSFRQLGIASKHLHWWGGEFLLGDREHFRALGGRLEKIWPRYLENRSAMAHVGDEMVLTVALIELESQGIALCDAGAAGAIARFWSARTQTPFPRFADARAASILHLPADKLFIANWAGRRFLPDQFLAEYERHLRRKIAMRRPAALGARLLGGTRRYAPRF